MSHNKRFRRGSWIQATLEKANSSRETALLASVHLLEVISEKALNILDAVKHVKDNKAEQGLVTEATASVEAFCNSYRHSTRQASWPSNGIKVLLHALSDILGEIEQYMIEQIDKIWAIRFINSAPNASRIKIFLQRLEKIVYKLENFESVIEFVDIALRDSLREIWPFLSPGSAPDTPDELRANGRNSPDRGRTAVTSILPESAEPARAVPGSLANSTNALPRLYSNERPVVPHLPQQSLQVASSLAPIGLSNDHQPSSSGYTVPTVTEGYSVSGSITQGSQLPASHTSSYNLTTSLHPDQGHIFPPPSGFPLAHPMPWVLVPPYAVPPQLIALLAQDPTSRVPPITINISNIGNSNDTTTIG